MRQLHRVLFIVSTALLAWLLMQVFHELGHALGAWLTGGQVTRVVLNPLAISRTDVEPNPQSLLVAWSGPIFGVSAPLALWGLAILCRWRSAFLVQFFAGFCLLANGLYLGVGSFGRVGDAGDILNGGSPVWALWLFGLATAPAGLWLWNGLGPRFGLGDKAEPVPHSLAWISLAAMVATVAAMVAWTVWQEAQEF